MKLSESGAADPNKVEKIKKIKHKKEGVFIGRLRNKLA